MYAQLDFPPAMASLFLLISCLSGGASAAAKTIDSPVPVILAAAETKDKSDSKTDKSDKTDRKADAKADASANRGEGKYSNPCEISSAPPECKKSGVKK